MSAKYFFGPSPPYGTVNNTRAAGKVYASGARREEGRAGLLEALRESDTAGFGLRAMSDEP
jgi:hypothetical protein